MLLVIILSQSSCRNSRKTTQIIVLAAVGDGFEVFRFAAVGDADSCDLVLLGHVHGLLFFHDGIVGKLIAGDFAALFHIRHSFGVVFAAVGRICAFTDGENVV